VPIYASESKAFPWKWLIVFLILVIPALLFLIREKFTGSRPAQRETQSPVAGSDSLSSGPLRKTDASAEYRGASVPSPTGIPASDDWYTNVAFRGLVLNETDHSPVPGAKVSVYACASPTSTVEKLTGTKGEFEVLAPPGYRYEVKVEADGFRTYWEDSFVITRPYYQMEILLTPKQSMRGRVVDNENAGIPDALVRLRFEGASQAAPFSAITDSNGAFAITNLPSKGWFNIDAYHTGFETGRVRGSLTAGNEFTVRMTPALSGGSVVGGVTDDVQKPVPGAQIELYDTSNGRLTALVHTDRQGAYRFSHVHEGNYLVRCTAEGYADTLANQTEVKLVGDDEARADFSINHGLVLSGIVVNQKDEPVPNAEMYYSQTADQDAGGGRRDPHSILRQPGRVVTTDKEGRFHISGLIDAQGQLGVNHNEYIRIKTRLRPSKQEQKVILDSGVVLRGTVSDSRGAAVERFNLTLRAGSGSVLSRSFITTDGHFEIHGLVKNSYQVMVRGTDRNEFIGAMELQDSTEINILLDSVPGGRGQSTLHILKSK
jgi:uncharacterized GH25 family protein